MPIIYIGWINGLSVFFMSFESPYKVINPLVIMSPSGRILLRLNNQLITWDSLSNNELEKIKYLIDSKIDRVRGIYNDGGIMLFNKDLFHHINRPINIDDDLVCEIVSIRTANEAYKEAKLSQKIYDAHNTIQQRYLSVSQNPIDLPFIPPNKRGFNLNPLYSELDKTVYFEVITPVNYDANLCPSAVIKVLGIYLGKMAKGIKYNPTDMNELVMKQFKGISKDAFNMLKGKIILYHNMLSYSLSSHFYVYLV